jgi:hypothetical protein
MNVLAVSDVEDDFVLEAVDFFMVGVEGMGKLEADLGLNRYQRGTASSVYPDERKNTPMSGCGQVLPEVCGRRSPQTPTQHASQPSRSLFATPHPLRAYTSRAPRALPVRSSPLALPCRHPPRRSSRTLPA